MEGRQSNVFFQLIKFRLSLAITCSALIGTIMGGQFPLLGDLIIFFCGLLCLTSGSAVLNNIQDRFYDALFPRTQHRPLPQGKTQSRYALIISIALITVGTLLLLYISIWICILGLAGCFCYNGLYTPLKKKTTWAMLPGTICGMIPPLMGWLIAPNDPFSPKIIWLMVCFGIWQMPHYWLILLKNRSNTASDTPLFGGLGCTQVKRLFFIWALGLNVIFILNPLFQVVRQLILAWILMGVLVVWTIFLVIFFLSPQPKISLGKRGFHLFWGISLGIIVLDHLPWG